MADPPERGLGVSTTEEFPDCEIDAGSEVKLEGNSRTGKAPSMRVAAADFNSSLVLLSLLAFDMLSIGGVKEPLRFVLLCCRPCRL